MPGPAKQFDPEEALDAAMRVFWARGYEAASMSELMEAMGLSKKSLYDTFGNKRSLFLKSLRRYAEQTGSEIQHALHLDTSPLKNIGNLLAEWQKQAARPNSRGCMIGTNIADFDSNDPEVAGILLSMLKNVEEAFYDNLKAAMAAGELNATVKPRHLARMLVAAGQGMALIGRVQPSGAFSRSVETSVMALLNSQRNPETV